MIEKFTYFEFLKCSIKFNICKIRNSDFHITLETQSLFDKNIRSEFYADQYNVKYLLKYWW